MAEVIGRRRLELSQANQRYRSPAFALDADTARLSLRIARPSEGSAVVWDKDTTLRVVLIVEADGVEHRVSGQVSGGERANASEYQIAYTLTEHLGETGREFIRSARKDAQGYYANVPLTRLGAGKSVFRGVVVIEHLRGNPVDTEILIAEAETQPVTRIRTKNSVAFDAATSASESAGDGLLSLSHTSTGDDRAVMAGVAWITANSGTGSTSMTYAGSGMTEKHDGILHAGAFIEHALYTAVGQTTGAQTVASDVAASEPTSQFLGVVSFTGVDQGTPVGTVQAATGTASPATVTVTSLTADGMVVDTMYSQGSGATVGADQTLRNTITASSNHFRQSTQSSNDGGVMSYTLSAPDAWGIIAIEFKPAAGGGGGDANARLIGGDLVGGGILLGSRLVL